VGEFFADARGGLPCEPGVSHGVVADEMACGCDSASDGGALLDVAADEEEGSSSVAGGENFEEAFGGDVVGAIVVGEGDLVGVAVGDEEFAEELGLGGEGGVGECACGGGCRSEESRGGYLSLCHVRTPVFSL